MTVSALLALAAAAFPIGGHAIGDAARWLQPGDFPSTEWHSAAITRYELMLNDSGRPVSCLVTGPSGSATVDKVACASLMERANYSPARDAQGKAVAQAIRGKLQWRPTADDQNELRFSADLSIRTPLLGKKQANIPVKVALIYAASGTIEQCVVIAPAQSAKLNRQACAEASRRGLFAPVTDARRIPIRGLREIEIIFSHGPKRQVTML